MANQLKPSSFASTDLYRGQIYGIYVNKKGYDKIKASDCIYVGKTCQKYVGDRFVQHVLKDNGAPWYNKNYDYNDYKKWPYVPFQIEGFNNWTRFDVAVAEQYHMTNAINTCKAKLLNGINALSQNKWNAFKGTKVHTLLKNSKLVPSNWNYMSLTDVNNAQDDSESMWTQDDTTSPNKKFLDEKHNQQLQDHQ